MNRTQFKWLPWFQEKSGGAIDLWNTLYVLHIFSFLLPDPSILGRACRMHNNPPSCDYERSDEDRGCQVKVYHSELDSDDYFEKKKVS